MKVCILSYTGLDTDGRDVVRILKEMKTLTGAGYEVSAIGLKLRDHLTEREEYYGVQIYRITTPLSFDRQLQYDLPRKNLLGNIRRLYVLVVKNTLASMFALSRAAWKQNADVYHCFGIYSLIPGFFMKVVRRKKVVYDCFDPTPEIISRIRSLGLFAKPLSWIVGLSESLMIIAIDYILTVSSADDVIARRFKKYNKNTIVLENVPELENCGKSIERQGSANGRTLFYVGALTRDKGIVRMVDVVRLLKKDFDDVKLVIGGSFAETRTYDNPKSEVDSIIDTNGLQENVVFLGFLTSREEIFRQMRNADMALHLYQPISWFTESKACASFFEYMAGSLPIIASDFPGFRSMIEENNCGITVNPTNSENIAAKITELIKNPDYAHKLGDNGRHALDKKYNWEVEEKKLLEVYSALERNVKN